MRWMIWAPCALMFVACAAPRGPSAPVSAGTPTSSEAGDGLPGWTKKSSFKERRAGGPALCGVGMVDTDQPVLARSISRHNAKSEVSKALQAEMRSLKAGLIVNTNANLPDLEKADGATEGQKHYHLACLDLASLKSKIQQGHDLFQDVTQEDELALVDALMK